MYNFQDDSKTSNELESLLDKLKNENESLNKMIESLKEVSYRSIWLNEQNPYLASEPNLLLITLLGKKLGNFLFEKLS